MAIDGVGKTSNNSDSRPANEAGTQKPADSVQTFNYKTYKTNAGLEVEKQTQNTQNSANKTQKPQTNNEPGFLGRVINSIVNYFSRLSDAVSKSIRE